MKNNNVRKFSWKYFWRLVALVLVFFVFIFAVIYLYQKTDFSSWLKKSDQLEVDFFDVGQGDAIFIKTPSGQKVLIDGGSDSAVLKRLGENMAWYDNKIDLVILTHAHADHLYGLIEVLKRYRVKQIMASNVDYKSKDYQYFLDIAENKAIPIIWASSNQVLSLGENCNLETIYPVTADKIMNIKNLNNTSVVNRLDCEGEKIIFNADLEKIGEEEILASGRNIQADVIKISHHGSPNGHDVNFIKKVDSKTAIISVGEGNKFNHPATTTLVDLKNLKINTWRTDLCGTIKIIGKSGIFQVKTQKPACGQTGD
jgi:beta-lactamase superfamily II metal-dependent hydrolase